MAERDKYSPVTDDRVQCIVKTTDVATCAQANSKISFAWNSRGQRLSDDDSDYSGATDDKRTYTYDARNNLITVVGKYVRGPNDLNNYQLTNAYDEKNRRIFKSFKDTDLGVEAQWFFYHDQLDRLIQAVHTPDIFSPGTYSVYQWYWLNDRPLLYYQTDYPSTTTSRRYLESDEQGRPHAAWDWPVAARTSTSRVWEAEAGTFGWDVPVLGSTVMQPLRFPGQYYDRETEAWTTVRSVDVIRRPGLCASRERAYDSFTGTHLEVDADVSGTWDQYGYAEHDPVTSVDPDGSSLISRASWRPDVDRCPPGVACAAPISQPEATPAMSPLPYVCGPDANPPHDPICSCDNKADCDALEQSGKCRLGPIVRQPDGSGWCKPIFLKPLPQPKLPGSATWPGLGAP